MKAFRIIANLILKTTSLVSGCGVVGSDFVLADISVISHRKLLIFDINNNVYRIKVSQKQYNSTLKTKLLAHSKGAVPKRQAFKRSVELRSKPCLLADVIYGFFCLLRAAEHTLQQYCYHMGIGNSKNHLGININTFHITYLLCICACNHTHI